MSNDKAQAIYDYLLRYAGEHGYPPTIREIGEEFGISSTNGVRHYLTVLERKGYLRRGKKISRGLELLEPSRHAVATSVLDSGRRGFVAKRGPIRQGIPILGRVAAGSPVLAEENVEGHLALEELFPSQGETFALRVSGESMKDRGILPGDLVIVRQQDHARDGDTIVALMGDDATVKTYRRTADGVDLIPANPDFSVQSIRSDDDFRVLGVVVGLIRPHAQAMARRSS